MEKKLLAISLTFLIALLGMFSSVGLVLANITAPSQAAPVDLIVVLGLLVCFMVVAGWLALRWFHQHKRKR